MLKPSIEMLNELAKNVIDGHAAWCFTNWKHSA